MDDRNRVQRRILLAGIGAISGLFSAVGAQIVLTQGGHVSAGLDLGFPLAGITLGAALGLIDLPKTGDRIVMVGITLAMLTIAGFAIAAPASAEEACGTAVTIGGTTTDLSTTSAEAPLIIDLGATSEISIVGTTGDIEEGTVEVSVQSVSPLGFLVEPGGTVLYYANIEPGDSGSTLQIEESGPTGFVISSPSFRSPVLPLGLVELDIIVRDTSPASGRGCVGTAWIRFVARPISNIAGLIGVGLSALGVAGFGVLHTFKDAMRVSGPNGLGPESRPPLVKQPARGPWIPSHGKLHAPYIESRLLDSQSQLVAVEAALAQGREYRLELTLSPGVREKDEDETTRHDMTVSGRSSGIDVEPIFQFGFSGTPLSIEIPITPRREGRHDIVVDVTSNGHLLQTDRLTISVVGEGGQQPTEPAQTTSTVFSASDFSASDLAQRKPRMLLVILESDEDGTVDARVRDQNGRPVVRFDSRLQAVALAKAADDMREHFQSQLQIGPGMTRSVSRERLEEMLVPLVKAGRQMHLALFPPGSVLDGDIDGLAARVIDGVTIQIVQEKAGLGYSTLPWNLVYDHPFQPHTRRNRLCPDFPEHSPDLCPNRDEAEVMCPTGFWGYRAIVEEPWVSAGTAILTPPVGLTGNVAIGYLDSQLSDSERQATALARLGVERLDDFDRLLDVLRDQSKRIGMMYFYAHHTRDRDIGTPGIAVEGELLSSLTFDALDVEWDSRPLIFINGCASGDYAPTDPMSLLEEFRRSGAVGAITTECALWDPLAGRLGEQIVNALADGREIGTILFELRRQLLISDNNLLGFVYRLHALSETTTTFGTQSADTMTLDLRTEAQPSGPLEDEST